MYDESYEVKERNLLKAVVYSFVTFSIYSFYWLYKLQQDTNRLMGLRNEPSPATVVVLSIVTLGIYWCYWAWRQGVKFRDEARARGSSDADDCPSLYLVLQLFNYLVGVTYIVNMVLMQDRINQMLRMRGQGERPYDPERFHHVAEADIAAEYKARAEAYEAAMAEDEDVQNALSGKRALFLNADQPGEHVPEGDSAAGDFVADDAPEDDSAAGDFVADDAPEDDSAADEAPGGDSPSDGAPSDLR